MSIISVDRDLLYRTRVRLNPRRTFISSSSGATGSVFVFPNRSITQKDNIDERLSDIFEVAQSDPVGFGNPNQFRPYSGNSLEQRRIEIYSGDFSKFGTGRGFVDAAVASELARPTNFEVQLALLLDGAGPYDSRSTWPPEIEKNGAVQLNTNFAHSGYSDLSSHPRNQSKKNISAAKGDYLYFSTGSTRLRNFIKNIIPHEYNNTKTGYNYVNFNCMNFFSDEGSYPPAICFSSSGSEYAITPVDSGGGFTIEFWLKPTRRQTGNSVVMHYGDHYVIWLEPTEYDSDNTYPTKFRLKFGFDANAHGTDSITVATDAISNSDILVDEWNHCSLRWGSSFNGGKISYVINGKVSGETEFAATMTNSTVGGMLVVGSKFTRSSSDNNRIFGDYSEDRYGSPNWGEYTASGSWANYFSQGLQSEIHEIRIWNKPKTVFEINRDMNSGINHVASGSQLKFHLPLLFETGSKSYFRRIRPDIRETVTSSNDWYGGRLGSNTFQTRFFDSPFNPNYALLGGLPDLNPLAYLKEHKTATYPALRNLDITVSSTSSITNVSNEWPDMRVQKRRTGFITPCDNGDFYPYWLNVTGSSLLTNNSQVVSLTNIGRIDDESDAKYAGVGDALDGTLSGRTDKDAIILSGSAARDEIDMASNLSTIVNVPILYYGDRIKPGSLEIHSHISSSIYTKLVDDGHGNLYRSNTSGSVAHWNKVGQVSYDKGAICIMSPHLFNFMQDDYKIVLEGEKHLNVFEINVPCEVGTLTQSKNQTYQVMAPTSDANETDGSFVYITGIYLHDENLNIVGKAHFAQPVVKRPSDNFLFRLKMDY